MKNEKRERKPVRPRDQGIDSDRVARLWRDWERSSVPFGRRVLERAARLAHRPAKLLVAATIAFALIAMANSGPTRDDLTSEIDRLQDVVTAREGELQLAQLELRRLDRIIRESATHRIPADLAGDIYDISLQEGLDPRLAFGLVRVESSFSRGAVSHAGAVGLTQLMPSTALALNPTLSYGDLFERETNLRLGFRYLNQMIDQYGGNLDLALLAYNRGPSRVDSILRAGGDPSNGYNRKVLGGRRSAN